MSFAADMQAFANTFNATYKNFKETGADEYNRARADEIRFGIAQRQGATAARAAGAAGDPNAMTAVHGVDTGDESTDSRAREMDRFSKFKTGEAGDFDTAVRTVYGEAAGEGDTGQKAVAATLANRAKASGRSIREEALRTGQYEPWMNRTSRARMLALDPNSDTYKRIASNVSAALAGDDPTGGATHFFAPRAQAALGRAPPSWALGQRPVTINNHNFYKLPYSGQGQHGLATRRVRTIRVDPEGNPIGPQAALDLEEEPTVYAAKGGVIPSYDTTQIENAGSNPVTRDVLDEHDDRSDLVNVDGARAAVAGGLRFGQRLLGLETHHAAIPDAAPLNPQGVRALTVNATAASPEDMATIHKTVDPQGKMPPELREIAGYNAERMYWLAQGEPQKAESMAWAMLGASKRAASQYGAVALATEDPKKRAEVIAQAYNHLIPDGNTMKITGGGKDGVNFAVHDAQGRVTEKGALAMDDMIQMATGMVNGTQWLQSMVKFATSAPTPAEKALEKRAAARTAFEESTVGTDERDYINTLDEDQRAKFLAQDPRDRKEVLQRHERRAQEEAKKTRFDERLAVGAENMDRKEALDLAKFSIRYGMWERTRDQVMTQNEQKLAQLRLQEEGRDRRFSEGQRARRQREIELDVLKERKGGRGAGGGSTAGERREKTATDALSVREQAIQAGSEVPAGTDVEGGPWTGPGVAEEKLAPIAAERGFQAERRRQKEMGDVSKIDMDATATELKAYREAEKLPPLTGQKADVLTGIAGGLASANRMSTSQAIRVAHDAVNPQVPIRMVSDPQAPGAAMVRFGEGAPVRLSADDMNLIAIARGGSLRPPAAGRPEERMQLGRRALPDVPTLATPRSRLRENSAVGAIDLLRRGGQFP